MIINNYTLSIKYLLDGKLAEDVISEHKNVNNLNYVINQDDETFSLTINPSQKIELVSACISYENKFMRDVKVFVNGYQSWTDSREFSAHEKMHSLNKIPKAIVKKYGFDSYGDYHIKKYSDKRGDFHGFSYAYTRVRNDYQLIGSLSEKEGYTIINYDIHNNGISIEKDVEGTVVEKEYKLFDLCILNGSEDNVFDRYFELMDIIPLRTKGASGYTSWYNHYQNINQEIILSNIDGIIKSGLKLDIFQIDDGYQTAVGDWLSVDSEKFPDGMKFISDKIKENNMTPGIWLAPFVCETKSEIYKTHKDWLLKDEKGRYVKAGNNWSGFYSLDIYNDEVREYIKNTFDVIINTWGYEMVKLDFLYAVSIIPYNGKSRGQIMCEAIDFLRECVGDKLILGCGVPLAPAFGKVDFCRIGCDIGLDYDDKFIMRQLHRERISTKNAMYNTIYRRQLDKRAFLNDPDVFLLRDDNIRLSRLQKEHLCTVNSAFGSLLFTSDNVGDYNNQKTQLIKSAISNIDCKASLVKEEPTGTFTIKINKNNTTKSVIITLKG